MGHWGTCPPSSFENFVHSADVASLTVKISKITEEIHVLNFHLSRQKEAHVNRLKQSWNQKEILGRGGEEKIYAVPPSPHFLSMPLYRIPWLIAGCAGFLSIVFWIWQSACGK